MGIPPGQYFRRLGFHINSVWPVSPPKTAKFSSNYVKMMSLGVVSPHMAIKTFANPATSAFFLAHCSNSSIVDAFRAMIENNTEVIALLKSLTEHF